MVDKMSTEQRMKQFVIRDPAPTSELIFLACVVVALYVAVVNADKIDAFFMWCC